jgi:dTDP-4-dehydrorhamnose reductase
MGKILVIGAGGQLGSELTKVLADRYGNENIIATDFQESVRSKFNYCTFYVLNVLDKELQKLL